MPEKDTDITEKYLDEDILFFMLKLIDYPDRKLKTFNFDKLNSLNFKKPISGAIFLAILEINNFCKITLSDFEFDRNNVFYSGKEGLIVKNHFNKIIHTNSISKSGQILEKVLENNFTLSDLQKIFVNQEIYFPMLLGGINFKITVTQELQSDLIAYLKKYAKLFEKDKLQKITEPYRLFADHEDIFQRISGNGYDKYRSANLVLKDFEFEKDFRLLEYILVLDFNGDIKINSIGSIKNSDGKNSFVVSINLSDKFLKKIERTGKKEATEIPRYDIDPENKIAIFKANGKAESIEIKQLNTQKSRFLKCLIDDYKHGRERTIESVFEIVYENKFNRKTGKYPHQFSNEKKVSLLKGKLKDLHREKILKNYELKFSENKKAVKMISTA